MATYTQTWGGKSIINGSNDATFELIHGTSGSDYIYGNGGYDTIHGGDGGDEIHGGEGGDTLYGENGNDYLSGDNGNDFLYGGSGRDRLLGGEGNDLLRGGTEQDILSGGNGRDTFQFRFGESYAYSDRADHITDFRPGYYGQGDTIDVTPYVLSHETFGSNGVLSTVSSIDAARYWANNGDHDAGGYGSAIFNSSNGHDAYVMMDLNGDNYMETGVVLENYHFGDLETVAQNHGLIFS